MRFNIIIIFITWTAELGTGARILAMLPYIGKSHFDVFEPYIKELAFRGHEVVVVSHFPQKIPVKNLTDINLVGAIGVEPTNRLDVGELSGISFLTTMFKELYKLTKSCNDTLSFHKVQELWKYDQTFDAVIVETFNTDCYIPFAYRFNAPLIGVSSCSVFPWSDYRMGNPHNPAYVPNQETPFSDRMNFIQRLANSIQEVLLSVIFNSVETIATRKYVNENLGQDLPSLSDLARQTSLILVNTHFTLNRPRPLLPGVIEVGGIHLKPPKKLPKDLEDYLNSAEHSVIYFSMGSMIRAETLPAEKRDALLQAFSELPQKVLWKWEGETMPGQPRNVRIVKWLPQFDLLNHPKVLVYMSHGGLLGTIEAVYAGVPMVGIPMYGDQSVNVAMVETAEMGVRLNYNEISKETVLNALKTVLDKSSYRENAKLMSRLYKDRPTSAMDTAIFWTEYVIRHKGARHMRSAALDLYWYEYLLLDVITAIVIFVIITLFITMFIMKKCLSILHKRTTMKKKLKSS